MSSKIRQRLAAVYQLIEASALRYHRLPESVQLLAVSKTRSTQEILEAKSAGQTRFGESYLQEALSKIEALHSHSIEWHFIGRLQSNKTRPVAEYFDWVHSVDRLKLAQRLSDQRPNELPPLNICLQVKIDQELSKGGASFAQTKQLIEQIQTLPGIKLRGLMTIPAPASDLSAQRQPFFALKSLRDRLATPSLPLETLSMGMSDDLEAAIAEGATMVRVGTAIFGPRGNKPSNSSNKAV